MNEQKAPNGIEWTRVWGRRGYTWNPVKGCQHGCRWTMPDGKTAICYAEEVAEGIARSAYPDGFTAHQWHPEVLNEPAKLKEPAGIFLDSMSDLMGHWVPDEQVNAVLNVCRQTPQHIYMLLTKNARRLPGWDFPTNVWAGVSTPPDVMFGKPLSRHQQETMLNSTINKLMGLPARNVVWLSAEPLSWDITDVLQNSLARLLSWVVIGAASNGRTLYAPDETAVRRLVDFCDHHEIPVFFKGNMRSLPWAAANWREEFPREPKDRS